MSDLGDLVGDTVWNSVCNSVWDSVDNSIWNSVESSVWNSVEYSVRGFVARAMFYSVSESVREKTEEVISDE